MSHVLVFLRRHVVAIVALTLLMGGGGVAYGFAGQQTADSAAAKATRIYACVKISTKVLTRTTASKSCPRGSRKISWSISGPQGAQGTVGPVGADGVAGPAGDAGATGHRGAAGPAGAQGAPGTAGTNGTDGTDGTDGTNAILDYAQFFALMPPDNAATVPVGGDVDFPQNGPADGTITRISQDAFNLAQIGTYRVTYSVPVSEYGQLVLSRNGSELAYTVAGRATGTTPIAGQWLVETTAINSVLTVRNPSAHFMALTVTPMAGGTIPVSASLIIERIS